MRHYNAYTSEDIVEHAKQATSIRTLLLRLNLRPVGGNYATLKRKIQLLKIDTSHWTGQGWCKDKQLKDWTKYTRSRQMKIHLIKELGHKCTMCGLSEWNGKQIPLEIEHIDGNHTNNDRSNLTLLCCNCHAQTPTWRGRNAKN